MSPKWKLDFNDLDKWLTNAVVFMAPVVVIYLTFVAANINTEGFAWSDFKINDVVLGTMVLYVVNVVLDFMKKLVKDNTASK
jgi:hypothetical protein